MHHCKIFWFRRRNKRESGGEHHVEEKDCRYQVKHCHDSQQVRKYAERCTIRARPSESLQQSSLSFSRTDDRRQVSKQMISTSPAGNVHYNCWKQIPFSSIASQVSQYSSLQTVVVWSRYFKQLKQEMVYTKHFFYFSTVYGKIFLFYGKNFLSWPKLSAGRAKGWCEAYFVEKSL